MPSNAVRRLEYDREGILVNWDRLVYLRTVARLGSISRAAGELRISQPALSRAIARLERDLGVQLFARTGRSIVLSRYGAAFLRRAEPALEEIEAAQREIADLATADSASVSLGFLRTLGAALAPQLVRLFRTGHPGVHFTFAQNNGVALEELLLTGGISLALTVGPPADPKLRWEPVTTQRLVLIVPAEHRLARRKSVKLAELREEAFLTFKPGHAVRDFTDALCRDVGFAPNIAFEADESNSIRGFVSAGFGIALVPQTGTAEDANGIRVDDARAQREVGIAWLGERRLSSAEAAFRAFAVNAKPALG
jgi:DNA-binding transcriptional LysR family regulator